MTARFIATWSSVVRSRCKDRSVSEQRHLHISLHPLHLGLGTLLQFHYPRFEFMKRTSVPLTALLAATLWVSLSSAQQPPPPPPPGARPAPPAGAVPPRPPGVNAYSSGLAAQPAYSRKGTIRAFNLGPN